MKKARKKIIPEQGKEELPLVPEENIPPESEEEDTGTTEPAVMDVGNPPPTKPAPIKK